MTASPRNFSGPALEQAAATARLTLVSERPELVGPVLTEIYSLIDDLDHVPLGEVPPATAFDARWE